MRERAAGAPAGWLLDFFGHLLTWICGASLLTPRSTEGVVHTRGWLDRFVEERVDLVRDLNNAVIDLDIALPLWQWRRQRRILDMQGFRPLIASDRQRD